MEARKVSESATVTEHISRVVMSLQEQGKDVIDPDYVANVVESRIDIHQVSPHLNKYLSIQQLKQQTRAYLRHALDPVQVVTDQVNSGQDDLFDDILQDHYPADREILGVMKRVYVKKEVMAWADVKKVSSRMSKASKRLAEHSEALIAWFRSK